MIRPAAWILLALLAAGCTIERRSAELACDTRADCASDRVCVDHYCVLAGSDSPGGTCPPACSACDNGRCIIDCTSRSCGDVTCPPGWGCTIACAANSCASIDCEGGRDCTITCTGTGACDNVTCGTRPCSLVCTGRRSCTDVDCADSCGCNVLCTSADACNNNIDCPAGCDLAGGCSSVTPSCNTCP